MAQMLALKYALAPSPRSAQGWNDTTACPESDFYGGPYPCEWWAPNCILCDSLNITTAEPVVLTCDGYLGTPAVSQATLS
jgi:hypothetical protein